MERVLLKFPFRKMSGFAVYLGTRYKREIAVQILHLEVTGTAVLSREQRNLGGGNNRIVF